MPGPVRSMTPMVVFPETLSRAFQEVQTYTARVCEYHDGSAQQGAMVSAPRHAWRLTKRLPPADLVALRDFVRLHIADTFFFYNPKECVPPYVGDPTGVATAGRYAVRVNSDWSQSCGIALTDAVVELIEVASMTVLMNTWITLSPVKGLSAPGKTWRLRSVFSLREMATPSAARPRLRARSAEVRVPSMSYTSRREPRSGSAYFRQRAEG